MKELRVETEQGRDERLKYLLFQGIPMPQGWKLPALTEPPPESRPEAQPRAEEEIRSLMAADFDSWRRVPSDAGVAAEPGKSGRWEEMTEFGKLDVMYHWVNWEGVSRKDQATLMAAHLDVNQLPPEVRTHLIDEEGRNLRRWHQETPEGGRRDGAAIDSGRTARPADSAHRAQFQQPDDAKGRDH
jgi:hypothetical protein